MRYFFLLILLYSFSLNAQEDYRPFIEEGKTFAIADRDGSICGYAGVYRYRFGEILEIEDIAYRNIERLNYSNDCPPFDAQIDWNTTDFLVRENIAERKVYLKLSENEEEFLLYDFSLEVGDSISTPFNIDDEYYPVIEVNDIELIDGTSVKEYVFSGGTGSYDGNFRYIEAVGSVLNTFGDFGVLIGYYSELLCVEVLDNLIYDGNCSGFVLSTQESEIVEPFLYPNPAKRDINIDPCGTSYTSYSLISSFGKVLHSQSLDNNNLRIDISELESGLYYLRLVDSGGRHSLHKFIKE